MKRITAPTAFITVDELKSHLSYDGTDHNTRLTSLITDGTDYLENLTDRAFTTQTWEETYQTLNQGCRVYLPKAPLQSVTSVKYYDADNVQQTLSTSDYVVTVNENVRGHIYFPNVMPTVYERPDCWAIRWVAGWATVPGRVRRVLLNFLGQLDFDREFQQQNFNALERAVASIRSDYL